MDDKKAVAAARTYLIEMYANENITNLALDEVEHDQATGNWRITLTLSRPWKNPRTRAEEALERFFGTSSLKRFYKVITITDDGIVISMKNKPSLDE